MVWDRRRTPRMQGPFDATWSGASGGHVCRVLDISQGGCFVSALTSPPVGEDVKVSVEIGNGAVLTAGGRVVSAESGMGFGVEFRDLTEDQHAQLAAWIVSGS